MVEELGFGVLARFVEWVRGGMRNEREGMRDGWVVIVYVGVLFIVT